MEEELSVNVVNFLNFEFCDLKSLKRAKIVSEKNANKICKLQSKIDLSSEKVPSELADISSKAEETIAKATELNSYVEQIQKEAQDHITEVKGIKDKFSVPLSEIQELQNAQCYLEWVIRLENISKSIESALVQGADHVAVTHFCEFKDTWNHLQSSQCTHLVNYIKQTILYWHDILKEKFGSNFDKILSSIPWPATSPSLVQPPLKFKVLFTYLLEIQLPDNLIKNSDNEFGFEPLLLPLQMMMRPLQKRFIFHFTTKKQTNRLDKPEWYLTQILMWIRDHLELIDHLVQPLLNSEKLEHIYAKVELMRTLVHLAMKKLQNDMPNLVYNEQLLTHTIDEVLLFEKELHNQGYPQSLPSTINILSSDICFNRWRNLEHKSALEKMDLLLNSTSAWKLCYQDGELDELKVPECAESFMTLLLTMTERYQNLPKPIQRLSFLELQLELLDDFRLRLHQLLHSESKEPLDSNFCAILNAINYILYILTEWSNLPFFQNMQQIKQCCQNAMECDSEIQMNNEGSSLLGNLNLILPTETVLPEDEEQLKKSVFDDIIGLLEHMKHDLLHTLLDRVFLDVKAKSRPYRKEKWFCMPIQETYELSRLAYPLLTILKSHLQKLQETLAKPLFNTAWQFIAKEINQYIYEEFIVRMFLAIYSVL
ncbi:RAD50-interacting protein 1 isoform X2 [Centruroides vittatus]|uniref:RAD50-interacting protein 1 isoform X2 n=1 Tax=Centruroides vittatus TaxID=120091 RepID=UPI003510CB1F